MGARRGDLIRNGLRPAGEVRFLDHRPRLRNQDRDGGGRVRRLQDAVDVRAQVEVAGHHGYEGPDVRCPSDMRTYLQSVYHARPDLCRSALDVYKRNIYNGIYRYC